MSFGEPKMKESRHSSVFGAGIAAKSICLFFFFFFFLRISAQDSNPETAFTCVGKVIGGYYADVETDCQMFHVCILGEKGKIRDLKFTCLKGTVFAQETRVCEREDEVDCGASARFYHLNNELYDHGVIPSSAHHNTLDSWLPKDRRDPAHEEGGTSLTGQTSPDLRPSGDPQTTAAHPQTASVMTCRNGFFQISFLSLEDGCVGLRVCNRKDKSLNEKKDEFRCELAENPEFTNCFVQKRCYKDSRLVASQARRILCSGLPRGYPVADVSSDCRGYFACHLSPEAPSGLSYCPSGHLFSPRNSICLPKDRVNCFQEALEGAAQYGQLELSDAVSRVVHQLEDVAMLYAAFLQKNEFPMETLDSRPSALGTDPVVSFGNRESFLLDNGISFYVLSSETRLRRSLNGVDVHGSLEPDVRTAAAKPTAPAVTIQTITVTNTQSSVRPPVSSVVLRSSASVRPAVSDSVAHKETPQDGLLVDDKLLVGADDSDKDGVATETPLQAAGDAVATKEAPAISDARNETTTDLVTKTTENATSGTPASSHVNETSTETPETSFTCQNKELEKFYPDPETGCRVFHYCTTGISNATIAAIKFHCEEGKIFDAKSQKCVEERDVVCEAVVVTTTKKSTVAATSESTTTATTTTTTTSASTSVKTTTNDTLPVTNDQGFTTLEIEAESATEGVTDEVLTEDTASPGDETAAPTTVSEASSLPTNETTSEMGLRHNGGEMVIVDGSVTTSVSTELV